MIPEEFILWSESEPFSTDYNWEDSIMDPSFNIFSFFSFSASSCSCLEYLVHISNILLVINLFFLNKNVTFWELQKHFPPLQIHLPIRMMLSSFYFCFKEEMLKLFLFCFKEFYLVFEKFHRLLVLVV